MTSSCPTIQDIESLLTFKTYLDVDYDNLSGCIQEDLMYVDYTGWISELMDELIRKPWVDVEYSAERSKQLLEDESLLASASLSDIKMVLTFLVRRDRFSAGSFGMAIESGDMRKIFNRLEVISNDMGGHHSSAALVFS